MSPVTCICRCITRGLPKAARLGGCGTTRSLCAFVVHCWTKMQAVETRRIIMPPEEQNQARIQHERLLRALAADRALTCEEADALIPSFVQAEMTGEDVDADPAFAALLR